MKRKCYSYLEIQLNDKFIGYATIVYHYYDYSSEIISSEILLYPSIKNILNISLAQQWPTYIEDIYNFANNKQDEQLTSTLLKQIIINLQDYKLVFLHRRDVFHLDVIIKDTKYRCFLVHENYFIPNFKQVQILANNRIISFDINKPDIEIQHEIVGLIMSE